MPWMRKPEKLIEIVRIANNNKINRRINYVYFRPSDLEFGDSYTVLKEIKKKGIGVYLTTSSRSGISSLSECLDNLLQRGILPNKLIVDQHSIQEVAANTLVKNNKIQLYVSAIMGFRGDNVDKLLELKTKYPSIDSVCLHHDAIFDSCLNSSVKKLKLNRITPILLANESCFNKCPYRAYHYEHVALKHPNTVDNYQNLCLDIRAKVPKTLKSISGFIHPNLIDKVSKETGITHFKITGMPGRGRNRTQAESESAINAYLSGVIPDDLMKIACFTYLRKNEKLRFNLDEKTYFRFQKQLIEESNLRIDLEGIEIKRGLTKEEKDSANYARVANKLNRIYSNNKVLPWTGLHLPKTIKSKLLDLPENIGLHFVGCGLGELTSETSSLGFNNISCSDISEVAIRKVRQNYPLLESYVIATQQLSQTGWNEKTVIDLHNLHQISPDNLPEYLKGIGSIADKILISWIYEPKRGEKAESDVKEFGMIYHHKPETVIGLLSEFFVADKFAYSYRGNPEFFKDSRTRINQMAGLYMETKK